MGALRGLVHGDGVIQGHIRCGQKFVVEGLGQRCQHSIQSGQRLLQSGRLLLPLCADGLHRRRDGFQLLPLCAGFGRTVLAAGHTEACQLIPRVGKTLPGNLHVVGLRCKQRQRGCPIPCTLQVPL